MSILVMYYYIHPESGSAWRQLKQIQVNPDGLIEEVTKEEYERALIQYEVQDELIEV